MLTEDFRCKTIILNFTEDNLFEKLIPLFQIFINCIHQNVFAKINKCLLTLKLIHQFLIFNLILKLCNLVQLHRTTQNNLHKKVDEIHFTPHVTFSANILPLKKLHAKFSHPPSRTAF